MYALNAAPAAKLWSYTGSLEFPSPATVSRPLPQWNPSSSKFFSAQTLPNRSKQEGIGRHRMPRPRNRIRLESQPVVGFEKSLGWISNPRVAGSIPAAPTNLFLQPRSQSQFESQQVNCKSGPTLLIQVLQLF